jgi:hypothetical protein
MRASASRSRMLKASLEVCTSRSAFVVEDAFAIRLPRSGPPALSPAPHQLKRASAGYRTVAHLGPKNPDCTGPSRFPSSGIPSNSTKRFGRDLSGPLEGGALFLHQGF